MLACAWVPAPDSRPPSAYSHVVTHRFVGTANAWRPLNYDPARRRRYVVSTMNFAGGPPHRTQPTCREIAEGPSDMTGRQPSSQQPDPRQADLLRNIHDEHAPGLQRYVLRLTRNDLAFAEDVVQESLLRLWQKPTILRDYSGDSVRAWLYTVARNLVIDDRRSSRYKRELQTETLPEQRTPDVFGPAVDTLVVTEALRSLSLEHRTVLVRAHFLGQTALEIAQHEQIPPGTVKSRLHYALRALRSALQERGVDR